MAMKPDPLQEAWGAQGGGVRVTKEGALLLREVQRNQRYLDQLVRLRDYREVGVALMLIVAWFAMSLLVPEMLWTWYLSVPMFIWITVFMLVFRHRYGLLRSRADDALVEQARESLRQVEDQIWLLRNVMWWYILPLTVPGAIWAVHLGVATSDSGVWESAVLTLMLLGLFVFVVWMTYRVNRVAVRDELEPRRDELLELLRGLDVEADEENAMTGRQRFGFGGYLGMLLVVCVISAVVLPTGLAATEWVRGVVTTPPVEGVDFPRLSPFEAVDWGDGDSSVPRVKVDGVWYFLGSIDAVPIDDLVEFSKATYGERWQKRIDEDLVEVMTLMGHAPGETVRLRMVTVETTEFAFLKDVAMTEANRRAVREARRGGEVSP
ncbi:hypothetical protein [Mucisphaera calidilacus]|uniref:Uncharacterized protein n=1 Tax=Mucisphaera calidilacus TaxID=2527982 RepID=A0A518C0Z8_9BACT|nr:hypothetical protein [Mucisphaera calidilacus]QDU72903.1 hypothetical protein Pan265_27790 [Mucisphaera calidilacus]